MLAAINFPSWIHPQVLPFFPNFPLRWYGIMYLIAFGITYLLFKRQVKQRSLPYSEDDISGFFLAGILGLIIGARIGGTLLYDPTGYYWSKPWLIFWPFSESGAFTGFAGMSFHGGLVGLIVGIGIYGKKHRLDLLEWADMIAMSVPLGFTFGRIGNFINGELWGKAGAVPWAMVFPNAERFSTSAAWVKEFARKADIVLEGAMVNLPRHPSQLYEALFEGIVLWLVMWFIVKPRRPYKGFACGVYVIGYGLARFVIEYFREPNADMGYILKLGDRSASIYYFSTPWNFSMGQLLCFLMIVGGASFLAFMSKKNRREASLQAAAEAERQRIQSAKKKLKKR